MREAGEEGHRAQGTGHRAQSTGRDQKGSPPPEAARGGYWLNNYQFTINN